jgi:hypothetical protein
VTEVVEVPTIVIGIFDGYAVARYPFFKIIFSCYFLVSHFYLYFCIFVFCFWNFDLIICIYVGTGFADVFYDFSIAEESISHFSRDIETSKLPTNIYGQSVKVLLMDIRAGAGGALYPFPFLSHSLSLFFSF